MVQKTTKQSKWNFWRWLFICITLISLIILIIGIRLVLLDAQMSLGVGSITGSSLQGMVVNQQPYTSPDNGVLRYNQLHVLLRVAEDLQWQHQNGKSKESKRYAFAKILNRHVMSLQEYKWIRTTAINTLAITNNDIHRVDSLNKDRLRLFEPRLRANSVVFRENLDSEAL